METALLVAAFAVTAVLVWEISEKKKARTALEKIAEHMAQMSKMQAEKLKDADNAVKRLHSMMDAAQTVGLIPPMEKQGDGEQHKKRRSQ